LKHKVVRPLIRGEALNLSPIPTKNQNKTKQKPKNTKTKMLGHFPQDQVTVYSKISGSQAQVHSLTSHTKLLPTVISFSQQS
jgi:hypothetical protein